MEKTELLRKETEKLLQNHNGIKSTTLNSIKEVIFEDLFPMEQIQRLQDEFADATGVASIITKIDGTPITKPSNFCRLCNDIIRKTDKGLTNCFKSDALIGQYHPEGPIVQRCMSGGLWDAGAGITVGGKHIANWLIGQVRDKDQKEEDMKIYARDIGVDETIMIDAFRDVPSMSLKQFKKIAQILFTLAEQLSDSAYQNLQKALIIKELKKAERKLAQSEERFRHIFDNINSGIAIFEARNNGEEFIFKDINPFGVKTGQKTRDNYLGRSITSVYPGAKETGLLKVFQDVWQNGKAKNHPVSQYKDNDVTLWLENFVAKLPSGEIMAVYDDLSEQRQAEKALMLSEERYRSVYDTAPLVFIVWDRDCKILEWNEMAETTFGWKRNEAIGKFFFDLIIPDSDKGLVEQIVSDMNVGKIEERVTYQNRTKSGETIWCEWNNSILYEVDGTILSGLSLGLDITNRIATENELGEYREHLEELVDQRTEEIKLKNKELETFTYSVSHDLKAPLRGIDGYSRLLVEDYADKLDEEGLTFLNNVRQSTLQMHRLIEDLLAYSRMERKELHCATINLTSLIDTLVFQRTHEIENRGITLVVDLPFDTVMSDKATLRQVFSNYLDNAIKFSKKDEPGTVTIGGSQDDSYWTLWVKDSGIGFDPKYIDRIFEIFQRLHRVEDYAGTGIGLAIVLKAVDRIGGRVRADSLPGKGATFFIDIPKQQLP